MLTYAVDAGGGVSDTATEGCSFKSARARHSSTLRHRAPPGTYAHVCSRMLTYAHVCSRMPIERALDTAARSAAARLQAPLVGSMLTYADLC